jgi:hypothetical protein
MLLMLLQFDSLSYSEDVDDDDDDGATGKHLACHYHDRCT